MGSCVLCWAACSLLSVLNRADVALVGCVLWGSPCTDHMLHPLSPHKHYPLLTPGLLPNSAVDDRPPLPLPAASCLCPRLRSVLLLSAPCGPPCLLGAMPAAVGPPCPALPCPAAALLPVEPHFCCLTGCT